MTRFVERYLAPALLLLCLVLGGASAGGVVANAVVQIASIAVVVFLVTSGRIPALPRRARLLLLLVALAAALMIVQLIPLPATLWSRLAGRSEVARSLMLAGAGTPWLPMSLAPDATIAGLLSLLPPLAMILAIYASSGYGRVYSGYAVIVFAIATLGLGLMQRIGGPNSSLYIYETTNRGVPVGLFANRNHLATLLLVTIPFVAALATGPRRKSSLDSRIARRLVAGSVAAYLVLGLIVIHSDAGWFLALPCLLASAAIFQRGERHRLSGTLALAALVTVAIAALLVALAPIAIKDAGDKLASAGPQMRNTIISTTLKAARDHLPVGSGGGSFPVIYPSYENPEGASLEFINHAHSDYAEFLLEYGVPGVVLLIFAFAVWIGCVPMLRQRNGVETDLMRAGFVAVALVAAHSLVDYPIRTAAIAAIVAMASALLVAPAATETPAINARRRRRSPSNRTIMLGLAEEPSPLDRLA